MLLSAYLPGSRVPDFSVLSSPSVFSLVYFSNFGISLALWVRKFFHEERLTQAILFHNCESNALTANTVLNSNYCNFIKSFPYLIQLPFIYASFHFNQYYRFIFFSTFGYNKYFLIFTAVSLVTLSQIHFSFAPEYSFQTSHADIFSNF